MPNTIGRFFLRILLWVPPVFAAWYVLVPLLHWPIRWFLSGMALVGLPEFVTSVTQSLHSFEFLTSLSPGTVAGQAFNAGARVSAEVDARLYSYGTALMAALTLAAWQLETVAYLYQFSTLIMPPVTALVVWFVLHRRFVEKFVGAEVIGMLRASEKKPKQAAQP